MSADAPTILATSGGFREGRRTRWEFSALTEYAIDLRAQRVTSDAVPDAERR